MRHAQSLTVVLALVLAGGCREQPSPDGPSIAAIPPSPEYSIRINTVPRGPSAGQETRIELTIAAPSGPAKLESIANYPVHLIAVNRDLTWYEHAHPGPSGASHEATLVFPADGEYILHAIAWPTGQSQLVQKSVVIVGNPAPRGAPLSPATSRRELASGAYTVRLRSDPEPPATGDWTSLIFDLSREGKPVTNLTPTGTLGHMVILREGGEDFVYAHSTDGEATKGVRSRAHVPALPPGLDDHRRHRGDAGPEVTFHTRFPHAGKYKMWVQFLAGADSVKADFVVEVGLRPSPKHVD